MTKTNLFTGTLNLLILQALRAEPLHGYAIGLWIRETSEGVLGVEEGQLYPALHRLEKKGWIRARKGKTQTGRMANFYRLTPAGVRQLEAEEANWLEYSDAMRTVLDKGRT